ncbi:MAG: flagellar motor switch protein FliM [Bacillota bacterium]
MQEVLSQSEIDKLLEALTSGKLQPEEAQQAVSAPVSKPYDFRRPNKFSREHLRTLEMVHQNFARLLSSFLSGYLRAPVSIELVSVGQLIFDEFIRSIPTPTVMSVFNLAPLEGQAILEAGTTVILPMLDLVFGGPGSPTDIMRELTDIEATVVRRLLGRVLEHLSQAWSELFPVEASIDAIESNPRMSQILAPNEIIALITLNVSINDEQRGLLNLCLPYVLLEPVISHLSVRQQFLRKSRQPKPEEVHWLKHWLGFSPLELSVILGESQISIREFLQLQEGDVLVLDRLINQDLDLYIEGELKFGVQPGRVRDHLAVQVVALKEGGDRIG